jgi:hypothetical protein
MIEKYNITVGNTTITSKPVKPSKRSGLTINNPA